MPGSHGSMTKAGKIRFYQTPERERYGVNAQKKKIPRIRYREKYKKIFVDKGYSGQPDSEGARREKARKRKEELEKKKKRKIP